MIPASAQKKIRGLLHINIYRLWGGAECPRTWTVSPCRRKHRIPPEFQQLFTPLCQQRLKQQQQQHNRGAKSSNTHTRKSTVSQYSDTSANEDNSSRNHIR